ncbi:hypothetical protein Tco_0532792 [Tanacetum coccineum]
MLPAKPSKGKAATSEPLEVFDDKIDLHGLPSTKELLDAIACHIMVERVTPQAWTNIIKSMSLEKLLDLHDNGYTRQAVVDNHLNDRVRDLIRVYKETKKELGLVTSREAELKAKYDGVVMGLDENPIVVGLQEEVKSLEGQLKDHEADYGRLLLEERKWASQKERIVVIESKCDGLEKERYKLGEIKIKLREEIDGLKLRCRMLKQDRAEVVSKVVSYIAMKLHHSDDV